MNIYDPFTPNLSLMKVFPINISFNMMDLRILDETYELEIFEGLNIVSVQKSLIW